MGVESVDSALHCRVGFLFCAFGHFAEVGVNPCLNVAGSEIHTIANTFGGPQKLL